MLSTLPLMAKDVVWFNGRQPVTYSFKGKRSAVIDMAMDLFAEDMRLLTGHKIDHSERGVVEIYELDKLKDKDFRLLQRRKIPIDRIIAKADAFYLGCEGGKVVIVGSNEYGTAYGLLELSRMAGVSPWVWWNDAKPEQKHYLALKDDFFTIQWPSVRRRAMYVSNSKFERKHLMELMLRLRGNELLDKPAAANSTTAVMQLPERWLPSTQPGFIFAEMKYAYDHGKREQWVMELDNPKVDSYQLSLFMDMAWNITRVSGQNLQSHMAEWLATMFGSHVAQQLIPVMTEYYHLVGIRKPEQMNVEFAADAFGNELERYIDNYKDVAAALGRIEPMITQSQKDAWFSVVKYPIMAAWQMAVKQLQALEARHIGRPQSFLHDEEALQSAVRSWKAHEEIVALTRYYDNELAGGKWHGTLNIGSNKLVSGEPVFPKKITKKEIDAHGKPDPVSFSLDTDNAIVRNATDYRRAADGCMPIQMLGHSMLALWVPQGKTVSYSFYSEYDADAVIRLAIIPTSGNRSFTVRVDDQTFSFAEDIDPLSAQGTADAERGQAVRNVKVYLSRNSHSIDISATGDDVIIDQIMVDYNPYRIFYMMPTLPALH